jgi:hypothetical protein|tara:strand:- start:3035 stop:3508 length:474 start_codon:yes stop_codon:yes gene_type:complete
MRRLKMETVYNCLATNENEILSESIHSFIETTIMDLLMTNKNFGLDFRIKIDLIDSDFIENRKSALYNQEFMVDISENIFLDVKYDAFCEFELNTTDETEVGLGMTGEICGVNSFNIEIKKIKATMSDNSEFDLSNCYDLKNFLDLTLKYLKISYGR